MKKRLITMLVALIVAIGILPTGAFAASSVEEALGEIDIYNGGQELSYPLCFLIQRKDEWIDHFAFLPVPPGRESYVSQLLQAEAVNYTFLLYLDALDQHRRLILHRAHYFVVEQEGRLRFFKGGEARR